MSESICPASKQCSQWAEIYFSFCLCSFKDGVSLSVGFLSVISWGVAEIPQIMTNYREKSAHGLSLAFLITWIIGDLFNLFGCILEPATLPTQYYMAMLYTIITTVLTTQTIYYGHIYPRMKRNRWHQEGSNLNQTQDAVVTRQENNDGRLKLVKDEHQWRNGSITSGKANTLSSPIPLPAFPCNSFPGRDLYYVSARSLTSSHTPIAGSFLAHRMAPSSYPNRSSVEEPLLDGDSSTRSAPNLSPKNLLCVVFIVAFLGVFNLHQSAYKPALTFENENQGYVLRVGRNILQASSGVMQENHIEGNTGLGTFLGWAMAVIYMGGRLPQIWLNIKRGNVEGLNPLMFVFALVGNTTYVASILLSSMEWVKIKPNLPWLVDAGGCVLLDTFILIQFIYFRHWIPRLRTRQKTSVLK